MDALDVLDCEGGTLMMDLGNGGWTIIIHFKMDARWLDYLGLENFNITHSVLAVLGRHTLFP